MRFSPYLNPPSFLLISVSLSRWFSLFSLEPPPPYVLHKFFNYTLQAPNFDPPMSTDPPKTLIASFFLWIHRFFNVLYPFYMYWRILSKLYFLIHRCPPIHRKFKKQVFFFGSTNFSMCCIHFTYLLRILCKLYFLIHGCPAIHQKF